MGIGIRGEGLRVPQINGTDKVGKAYKSQSADKIQGKKDDVTISNDAKDFNMVMKALKDVPDVREDKVREVTERYESGNYDVGDKEIAEKMLDELLQRAE